MKDVTRLLAVGVEVRRAMTFMFECAKMQCGGRRWRTKTVAVGAGD